MLMLHNRSRLRNKTTNSHNIIFTGGLNEEKSNLELTAGELIDSQNYMEVDGSVNGYVSFPGYERYDGHEVASLTGLNIDPTTGTIIDDIERETVRATILPMDGDGITRGVAIYKETLYGWRDDVLIKNIFRETYAGWLKLDCITMNAGGDVKSVEGRFSLYKSNYKCLFWVDSVSDIHTYNGVTVEVITAPAGVVTYATHIGIWNNRLFLAYPGGHVIFSAIGDPTDFNAVNGAGEIFIGDHVTDFEIATAGNLIVFTRNSIQSITDTTTSVGDFQFQMDPFSRQSGSISGTAKRMLGTIFFADDRGVTTLESTAAYGDLTAKSVSKKVNKTYLENRENISTCLINRQYNQYIVFFNKGTYSTGLVMCFSSKRLKGCHKIKLAHQVHCATEGKTATRDDVIYFGSDDGMVYKMYSGTSFDGTEIVSFFQSTYYHYGSPTNWKNFRTLTLEVEAEGGTVLDYRCWFDYRDTLFPNTETYEITTDRLGTAWGAGIWGSFVWSSSSSNIDRNKIKVVGYGTSLSIRISSVSKYSNPHSVHNCIVEYALGNDQN